MTSYDILIIGAGPAGLAAALQAAGAGRRTLLLEGGEGPGGCWTTLQRGRFAFEARPAALGSGTQGQKAQRLIPEVRWRQEKSPLRLISQDGGLNVQLPSGVQPFAEAVTGFCQGSWESVSDFFELAAEAEKALEYLEEQKKASAFTMLRRYPLFVRCASHTVDEVLGALNMPPKAANALKAGFYRYGCDCGQMNFVDYAVPLLQQVRDGVLVPEGGGQSLMLSLEKALLAAGGEIWYHSPVEELLVDAGQVCGVRLAGGYEVRARAVVADAHSGRVLGPWLGENAPEAALRAAGARGAGAQGFAVFLGLSRPAQALGVWQERLILQDEAEPAKEYEARKGLRRSGPGLAVCTPLPQNERGCSLALYGLYSADAWAEVGEKQYEATKNAVAKKMIACYEKAAHVRLQGAIEECYVAGPAEYARWGGGLAGQVLWQSAGGWRAPFAPPSRQELWPLPGLRLCGDGSGAFALEDALCQGAQAGLDAAGMKKEAAR